jgi:hypothetical protein
MPTAKMNVSATKFAPVSIAFCSDSGRMRGLDRSSAFFRIASLSFSVMASSAFISASVLTVGVAALSRAASAAWTSFFICRSMTAGSWRSPSRMRISIRCRRCANWTQIFRNRWCSWALRLMAFWGATQRQRIASCMERLTAIGLANVRTKSDVTFNVSDMGGYWAGSPGKLRGSMYGMELRSSNHGTVCIHSITNESRRGSR